MARDFNGTSDYLENSASVLSAYPFTMACNFNTDSNTAEQFMMCVSDVSVSNIYHAIELDPAADLVRATSRNAGGTADAYTSTSFTTATDHHACGVFTSATDRAIFIDGGSKGTNATSTAFNASIDTTTIGRLSRPTPAVYTNGRLSEAGIWNVALTDAEVAILASGTSPKKVRPQNLVSYWEIMGRTAVEPDLVGGFPLTVTGAVQFNHPRVVRPSAQILQFPSVSGASSTLTGTATASITEADIVTGAKTIILTLTGDTFVAAGTGPIGSTADTQALIDGLDSAQVEATGWNAEVRDKEVTTAVVRTSSTVATITLTASAAYDITAQETITATIPGAVLTGASPVVAAPTFTVDFLALGGPPTGSLSMMGMGI